MAHTNGDSSTQAQNGTQTDIRLYKFRASYTLPAALSIFREAPVAHVAFVHPGDEASGREETIMNIPLITIIMRDPTKEHDEYQEEDGGIEEDYAVYLHTHKQSGLVEAVSKGIKHLTASSLRIDGMVLSPTAHDHSLNYRSATLHLHSPQVLSDDDLVVHEEKRACLAAVTNTVTGYERTALVGLPNDPNVKRTTVVKCLLKAASCKQRHGAFSGGKEPVFEGPSEDAFTGVVPCWTQWGYPLGYGRDAQEVGEHFLKRSQDGQRFAEAVAWGSEDVKLEGLGQKRKPTE